MRRIAAIQFLCCLAVFTPTAYAPVGAAGGPAATLSPAEIQQAIDIGRNAKATQAFLEPYRIVGYSPTFGVPTAPSETPTFGVFSTPFSRVVIASCEARRASRPFTTKDVTEEMLRPELHVLAFRWNEAANDQAVWCLILSPRGIGPVGATSVPPVMNVEDVEILPSANGEASAIRRLGAEVVTSRQLGLPEHIWYGRGVKAVFPLNDVPSRAIFRLKVTPGYADRLDYPGRTTGRPRFAVDFTTLR